MAFSLVTELMSAVCLSLTAYSSLPPGLSVPTHPPLSVSFSVDKPQSGQCRERWQKQLSWNKDSICPQLTQFTPEGVVLRKNGVGVPHIASSNKPVHVGVPAVHKATEMIFFKVTFWQERNKNRLHVDVVMPGYTQAYCSLLLDTQICFSLPLTTGIFVPGPLDNVGQEERSCNEQRL